ncbi:olfactory receptor 2AJ1-like [Trichosurus vulpecula]|uniref:olfactory receptor 2AJ1-like n=1 Tax=Trichosurus vulpecula TaxID=9337 RepID=UPI00186B5203|nr:olfactory receptor 2AJ1-like [Trichosurus vulpecula]
MWEEENQTFSRDFILLGLLHPNQHGLLFLTLFLIIFMVAITGNTVLILLIHLDSQLHTPMYFLLSHLSFMDILHISNIVPKMASNYISGQQSITFVGCAFQIFLSLIFLGAECLLLVAMSYDRYVAICHPLRYPVLMNHQISVLMAAGCWIVGTINSTIHTTYALHLPFCGTRVIDHFFCEVPAMLKLSCVDTSHYEGGVYVSAVFFLLIPFSIILASYAQILRTVLHIKSVEAQKKAFSTCSSHLTVVVMYYGPFIFTYMRPKSYHTPGQDKVLAILYTILTPMLNPLIYSLRNKDVLCALKKVVGKVLRHRN